MAKAKKVAATRTPGRPRSDASRSAILKAAYQILREGGFAQFTVEGVAAQAGAGKATIYRWWASKGMLAVEAFMVAVAPQMDAISESEEPLIDLRKQLHLAAAIYRGRAGQLLRELMALRQADEETSKQLVSDFLEPRRKAAFITLNRALEHGDLKPGIDLEVLADALWGPIFHRVLVTQTSISKQFIDKLLDLVFAGATAQR